ncbi:cytochrome c [Flaviaesturariibacter flavus]|uniref:Cytochrome c n=1 Tax=Flaviaesturariibacter flavus TaxID=2502780 RepID=A0A4R1B3U8_9BACT|nr:cytochrome c [Flaviaesturariibacter flavus]TCJ12130.1 cytochrome c [Flaviaesturariibacter flavus]
MRKTIWSATVALCSLFAVSCGSGSDNNSGSGSATTTTTGTDAGSSTGTTEATAGTNPKGVGPISEVKLNNPLDQKLAASGKSVYEVKCASCHKLSGEKLVGPGWKGVTTRRTPEWIMNFVMNTEEMLNKDAEAQKMLEVCMVRMPNQSLTETDARSVLEFMFSNDGKK